MDRTSRGDTCFLCPAVPRGRGAPAPQGDTPCCRGASSRRTPEPPASSLRSSAFPRPLAEGTGLEHEQRGLCTYPLIPKDSTEDVCSGIPVEAPSESAVGATLVAPGP